MNYEWDYKALPEEGQRAALALADALGVSPKLGEALVRRGVDTREKARSFLRPSLADLHDPFLFRDMDKAVARLNEALGRKERILVYGDYDVDGCSAVALVYRFLERYYSNIDYYIPDRNGEGYGVTPQGIDYAVSTGASLVIALDCGIKAVREVALAKERGVDFIICDHHVPGAELPRAVAVLDAKREDNTYPFGDLCGCGVGYKLVQAFARDNGIAATQLTPLLDLCAISIAADIVPVTGENRILCWHGLRQLNSSPSMGVRALMEICGLEGRELTVSDIVFRLGPRINAAGRVEDAKEAVALLIEKSHRAARERAARINGYNERRKDLDKAMTDEANRIVAALDHQRERKAIVLYNEDWHKGVVGIVASRLTETCFRPSVVLTRSGGMVTGSARSVAGFDVYSALVSCRDLLEDFGGHIYAAGLTMRPERVDEFRRRFEDYVEGHILPEQTSASITVDAMLDFKDIDRKFAADLRRLNPFGPENAKPLFCTRRVYDYGTSKVVGREQEHIKLELVDSKSDRVLGGIAFGQSSQARLIKTKQSFDIVYSVEENTHKRGEVQLQIEDIKPSERPAGR